MLKVDFVKYICIFFNLATESLRAIYSVLCLRSHSSVITTQGLGLCV